MATIFLRFDPVPADQIITNKKTIIMENLSMNYNCEHQTAPNGEREMILTWLNAIEMYVNFTRECGAIICNGEVKNEFSISGMPVELFEIKVEQCQMMDDEMDKFKNEK